MSADPATALLVHLMCLHAPGTSELALVADTPDFSSVAAHRSPSGPLTHEVQLLLQPGTQCRVLMREHAMRNKETQQKASQQYSWNENLL